MPNEQDDDRADGGANQTGPLIEPIPADRLADEGCDEGAHDAKHGREDKAAWIAWTGRQPSGNKPGDKAYENDPENVHVGLPDPSLVSAQSG